LLPFSLLPFSLLPFSLLPFSLLPFSLLPFSAPTVRQSPHRGNSTASLGGGFVFFQHCHSCLEWRVFVQYSTVHVVVPVAVDFSTITNIKTLQCQQQCGGQIDFGTHATIQLPTLRGVVLHHRRLHFNESGQSSGAHSNKRKSGHFFQTGMVQDPFFVLQSVVHFVSDVGGVDHEIARVQTIRRNHDHRVVGGANGFYAAHVRTFLDGKEEEEEDLYFPGFLCSCILLLSPFHCCVSFSLFCLFHCFVSFHRHGCFLALFTFPGPTCCPTCCC
jgi:hypothetical protein